MRTKTFLPGVAAGFAVMLILAASNSGSLAQEGPVALAGQIRSTAEGLMEGVVVSAKKAGSTVTVSVISDARGQYSFPRNRLAPGQYSLSIRAVGYETDDPGLVEVTGNRTATTNFTLHKAKDLSSQLTNAEWLVSMPGTDDQKAPLLTCVVCHTLEPHRQIEARCGGIRESAGANGDVYEFEFSAARAETTGAMAAGTARGGVAAVAAAVRSVPQHDQSELLLDMDVSAQDVPATQGERHAGHHHGVRPSARHHRAARRHRGCAGDRLVFQFRRTEHRTTRSQDGKGH